MTCRAFGFALALHFIGTGVVCSDDRPANANGLALEVQLPAVPIYSGVQVYPVCVITNQGAKRIEGCILSGQTWEFHPSIGANINNMSIASHLACREEFSLGPGDTYTFQRRADPPEALTGSLTLWIQLQLGPRDESGKHDPDIVDLRSKPVQVSVLDP